MRFFSVCAIDYVWPSIEGTTAALGRKLLQRCFLFAFFILFNVCLCAQQSGPLGGSRGGGVRAIGHKFDYNRLLCESPRLFTMVWLTIRYKADLQPAMAT